MFLYKRYNNSEMMGRKNDRFARVIHELNKSAQSKGSNNNGYRPSSQISMLGRSTMNTSQRSTKYTHTQISSKTQTYSEEQTLDALLDDYEVLVNRNRTTLRTEFIPTCKGIKYVLTYNQKQYVNLSWLHSAKQLEKNKILLLYYSMEKIKIKQKPEIESLVVQFGRPNQLQKFLSAVLFIHAHKHDDDVEKVYQQFCNH